VNAGFSVQTGEIRSRGFEAEASASLTDGLELIATYTLMDIEVTKSTQGGKTPIVTPEEILAVWLPAPLSPRPPLGAVTTTPGPSVTVWLLVL